MLSNNGLDNSVGGSGWIARLRTGEPLLVNYDEKATQNVEGIVYEARRHIGSG